MGSECDEIRVLYLLLTVLDFGVCFQCCFNLSRLTTDSLSNSPKKISMYGIFFSDVGSYLSDQYFIFCKLLVYCSIYKEESMAPTLCYLIPIHIVSPYFLKITFQIIFPSIFRSSKWFFCSGSSTQTLYKLCQE